MAYQERPMPWWITYGFALSVLLVLLAIASLILT